VHGFILQSRGVDWSVAAWARLAGGRQLLRYFGEEFDGGGQGGGPGRCGACDVCVGGARAGRDCWWETGAVLAAVEGNGAGLGRKDAAWWADLDAHWAAAAAALRAAAGEATSAAVGRRDKSFWRGLGRWVVAMAGTRRATLRAVEGLRAKGPSRCSTSPPRRFARTACAHIRANTQAVSCTRAQRRRSARERRLQSCARKITHTGYGAGCCASGGWCNRARAGAPTGS
jgi:hypothetical protein